jgi:transcriptional regulator with XRE-family HTH domain
VESLGVGRKIKHFRQQRGITQMGLAELVGVSYQQIQKYEKEKSQLTLARLLRIADALEVNVQAFFSDRYATLLSERKGVYSPAGRREAVLSMEERRFIRIFRRIKSLKVKQSVLRLLESMAGSQKAP